MILFPAIDLKDGACVRLELGEIDRATTFNNDPAAQARSFQEQGFRWIHVVDLNGAFAGKSVNGQAVKAILDNVSIPIQLGGGLRSMSTIDGWLERGVSRVILGTAALKDPELVQAACRAHPGKIAVGIDAKGGKVAVEGWAETASLDVQTMARRFEDVGVSALIFTDIDRDGVLKGLNIDATLELAKAVSIPVIASGGLADMSDIFRLCEPDCAILEGAISGRALYDGRLDPETSLRMLEESNKAL